MYFLSLLSAACCLFSCFLFSQTECCFSTPFCQNSPASVFLQRRPAQDHVLSLLRTWKTLAENLDSLANLLVGRGRGGFL